MSAGESTRDDANPSANHFVNNLLPCFQKVRILEWYFLTVL